MKSVTSWMVSDISTRLDITQISEGYLLLFQHCWFPLQLIVDSVMWMYFLRIKCEKWSATVVYDSSVGPLWRSHCGLWLLSGTAMEVTQWSMTHQCDRYGSNTVVYDSSVGPLWRSHGSPLFSIWWNVDYLTKPLIYDVLFCDCQSLLCWLLLCLRVVLVVSVTRGGSWSHSRWMSVARGGSWSHSRWMSVARGGSWSHSRWMSVARGGSWSHSPWMSFHWLASGREI